MGNHKDWIRLSIPRRQHFESNIWHCWMTKKIIIHWHSLKPRLYVFNYIQNILFIFNKKQVQSQPFTSFVENLTEKHTAVKSIHLYILHWRQMSQSCKGYGICLWLYGCTFWSDFPESTVNWRSEDVPKYQCHWRRLDQYKWNIYGMYETLPPY